ncbi:MAG TPA: hypothetical protein VHK63_07015 [Candidatus Limnocylindria bacterium]|nr:hypothetical protein [Candidatus Limnocylindria bacterium]
MSSTERQSRPIGRTRPALAVVALSLLLAACGGGEDGGDGGGAFTLLVSFGNQTEEPATVALGEQTYEVEGCQGGVYRFNMPDTDWVVTVNGQTAIDSIQQDPNDIDNNATARLWLREDGTIELEDNRVLPGSNIIAPSTAALC